MTAVERALVRRAGRKQHFATRAPGAAVWVPICEVREVPAFGAEVEGLESWSAWLHAAQADVEQVVAGGRAVLCSRCRTPLLVAALALRESRSARVDALEQENRRLRAEVSRWTTAALEETRKAGEFFRDHVVFRRAAR